MEGGVALFLLFIIVVVAAIAGIALYLTGGGIIAKSDREEHGSGEEHRPVHERATSPTQEKVTLAGTGQDDRESSSG